MLLEFIISELLESSEGVLSVYSMVCIISSFAAGHANLEHPGDYQRIQVMELFGFTVWCIICAGYLLWKLTIMIWLFSLRKRAVVLTDSKVKTTITITEELTTDNNETHILSEIITVDSGVKNGQG